jgi:hypothetical protein
MPIDAHHRTVLSEFITLAIFLKMTVFLLPDDEELAIVAL